MTAIWIRTRSELRSHLGGVIALILLVGVIGGVVIGGVAAWLRQSKWRRAARLADSQARDLRTELDRLKRSMGASEQPVERAPARF